MNEQETIRLYTNFQKADFSYLKKLFNEDKISENICEKLLSYWDERISNKKDQLYLNYFDYYLFFEFIQCAVIGAFFYDLSEKKIFHQYGILNDIKSEVLKTIKKQTDFENSENEDIDETIDFLYHSETFSCKIKKISSLEKDYILITLFPKALEIKENLQRLERVFLRYYLPDSFKPDERFYPLFNNMNDVILKKINPVLEDEKPVTFSYYKFENFEKYMEFGGEFFSRQLISEIQKEFLSRMKTKDTCFILSPREYLIVSLDCEMDDIKDRFSKLAFKIKNLILAYKVKYSTFFDSMEDLSEIWSQISIRK